MKDETQCSKYPGELNWNVRNTDGKTQTRHHGHRDVVFKISPGTSRLLSTLDCLAEVGEVDVVHALGGRQPGKRAGPVI